MRLGRTIQAAAGLALAVCLAACGGGDAESAREAGGGSGGGGGGAAPAGGGSGGGAPQVPAPGQMPSADDLQKMADQTAKNLQDMNQGVDVKAVDPERITALFPASVGRNRQMNLASQHTNAMGMDVSEATADYPAPEDDTSENPPSYHVKVTDIGNMKGAASMGMTAWAMVKVDRRTETGWEKTTKVGEWPAWEQYDREGKSGELKAIVAKRFIVEVTGDGVSPEQLRAAIEAVDLTKLAGLGR